VREVDSSSGGIEWTYGYQSDYSSDRAAFHGGIIVGLLFFFGEDLHDCWWIRSLKLRVRRSNLLRAQLDVGLELESKD